MLFPLFQLRIALLEDSPTDFRSVIPSDVNWYMIPIFLLTDADIVLINGVLSCVLQFPLK
jgi:hypothetical protein